jgi:hypothetical protein
VVQGVQNDGFGPVLGGPRGPNDLQNDGFGVILGVQGVQNDGFGGLWRCSRGSILT